MKFLKNNMWMLLTLAFVFTIGMFGDAAAESIETTAKNKLFNVFNAVKTVLFILGGFGLVGLAAVMVFGKANWKWFALLATGLAILAAAGAVVNYATGAGMTAETGGFGDTFTNSAQ